MVLKFSKKHFFERYKIFLKRQRGGICLKSTLGNNIKRLRLESNMTQRELADSLNISIQAVSKWETARSYPDVSMLPPLSKLLSVSIDELFRENK